MADWLGADGSGTADRYRLMAEEVRGASPSYEGLCLGVADDAELLALLDSLPRPKRQPNLLLGAVRYLGGPVDTRPAFREFVVTRWDAVRATMLARRTQTNEPGRCATLLPVLAALPQPLALLEVGASAGLCLYPDRYSYRYTASGADHVVGSAALELPCAVSGPVPLPSVLPDVAWRAGLDLNPLDVRSEDDMRWLQSLVWPEQTDRLDTLHAAAAVAREDPPRIETGDLTVDLAALAADAPAEATLVIFHTAVLAYVDDAGRAAFAASVAEVAGGRRTVWISNEAPGVLVGTAADDRSRFVLAVDGRSVARTGAHGASLDWLA